MIKVLFVDDDWELRKSVVRALSMCKDMTVIQADGAEDAIKQLDEGLEVDVILTDFSMYRLNGVDLIERIYKGARYTLVPCILLTASDRVQVLLDAKGLQNIPVLKKPARIATIEEAIRSAASN